MKDKTGPVGIVMSVDGVHLISAASGPPEFDVIPVAAHISLPMKAAQIQRQGWIMTADIEVSKLDEAEPGHLTSHSFDRDAGWQVKLPIVCSCA
jgi:hypothetical protein